MTDIDRLIREALGDDFIDEDEKKSMEMAKEAKLKLFSTALEVLRGLDKYARYDVCENAKDVFERLSNFVQYGNEEIFSRELDKLSEAIEETRGGKE